MKRVDVRDRKAGKEAGRREMGRQRKGKSQKGEVECFPRYSGGGE